MALTTAVFVGEANNWLPEIAERASKLKVSAGHEPDSDLGPVISPEAKERIAKLVQSAVDEGASLLVSKTIIFCFHWIHQSENYCSNHSTVTE